MKSIRFFGGVFVAAALALGSAGCGHWVEGPSAKVERTSLVKYLYPREARPTQVPTVPTLRLPLRVGVAWVPASVESKWSALEALPEAKLQEILARVGSEFGALPFIKDIQVIPSAYLEPEGGFENLDQLRTMFGIDVVALVSRDQKQFTDQTELSVLYWTIVGAYLVPAERNETYTMVDTAVFDIKTRQMLFRAPGTSRQKEFASMVTASEEFRDTRIVGLERASTNMVVHLKTELASFQQRIKDKPETAKIEYRPGYTGGGSGGWVDLAFVAALAGLVASAVRRRE